VGLFRRWAINQPASLQVCKSANCGFLAAYLGSSSRQRQMCQRSRFPGFNLDDDVLNTSSRVDRHSMFNGSMISSSHHEFQTFTNGNVWLRLDSNHIWVCLRMGYTKCWWFFMLSSSSQFNDHLGVYPKFKHPYLQLGHLGSSLWAGLWLKKWHHHNLRGPKSQRTHLPGSQQMRTKLIELVRHFWADLGRQSCHHQHWAPSHHWPIHQDCSKGAWSPQVTTRSPPEQCKIHQTGSTATKNPKLPYFGGLWERKCLDIAAWQSYTNLKHRSA